MTGNHLSDEQLLAYLDGEAGLCERYRARLHFFACWDCRARSMEMKEAVRLACDAYRSQSNPPPADVERARQQWIDAVLRQEWTSRRTTVRNLVSRRLLSAKWIAGAIAAAAAATVLTIPPWRQEPPKGAPVSPRAAATPQTKLMLPGPISSPLSAPPVVQPRFAPAVVRPSFDLDAIEARAQYLLHGLGVCRGEAVRLDRSAGGLRLTGYVGTQARREQIVATLAAAGLAPPIHCDIRDWEAGLPASSPAAEEYTAHSQPPARTNFSEAALKQHFRSQGVTDPERLRIEITRFTDEAFHLSDDARTAASALKQLSERWSDGALARLEPGVRSLVLTAALSHASELRESIHRLGHLCGPVFEPESLIAPTEALESQSWQEAARRLGPEIHQLHRLSAALFAGDRVPEDVPEASVRSRFSAQLRSLSASVTVLEQMAHNELSHIQAQRREP